MIVSLLAVGIVAVAGGGLGPSTTWEPQQAATGDCDLRERGANNDGVLNWEDTDCTRPLDGGGRGERQGCHRGLLEQRPLDRSGFGVRQGAARGDCAGSCQ